MVIFKLVFEENDCWYPEDKLGLGRAQIGEGGRATTPDQKGDYGGLGFPDSSDGKESTCNAGDLGSIPGLGRSPSEGIDYPLQYSCLENLMDRGAWRATDHGVAKSWTQLSN